MIVASVEMDGFLVIGKFVTELRISNASLYSFRERAALFIPAVAAAAANQNLKKCSSSNKEKISYLLLCHIGMFLSGLTQPRSISKPFQIVDALQLQCRVLLMSCI